MSVRRSLNQSRRIVSLRRAIAARVPEKREHTREAVHVRAPGVGVVIARRDPALAER